jgi:AcrR family transcriptional regulator
MTEEHGSPDGRRARWSKHNEQRRRQIIDAAIEVLEERPPGTEIHVQQIAEKAGLNRTVVYRHFADRADLDQAVQQAILDGLWEQLLPAVSLDGTVPQIIERIVGTYVAWAVAHPALHRVADHDTAPEGPLEQGLERLAGRIAETIEVALVGLGARPSEEEAAAIDPLVYGLVGAVFNAVRRWVARPGSVLTPAALTTVTSRSVWFVIDGHARDFGVEIDPDRTVEELLATLVAG